MCGEVVGEGEGRGVLSLLCFCLQCIQEESSRFKQKVADRWWLCAPSAALVYAHANWTTEKLQTPNNIFHTKLLWICYSACKFKDLGVSQASLCHHEARPWGNFFPRVVSARTLAWQTGERSRKHRIASPGNEPREPQPFCLAGFTVR